MQKIRYAYYLMPAKLLLANQQADAIFTARNDVQIDPLITDTTCWRLSVLQVRST